MTQGLRGNFSRDVIAMTIGAIVLIGVAIPITLETAGNTTGTTATVIGIIPLMLALLIVMVAAKRIERRLI